MSLFATVASRLRQRDLLQALVALFALLIFALAVGWPGAGDPNGSWSGVAQARSVAVMLLAVGFGVFGAADPKGWLETLLGLSTVVLLALPLEALAYAASYPAVPLWWTVAQPLLDTAAYFGIGLLLGRATRRVPALWPLLPPLVFVGLLGLSVWLERPLLNPVASALQVSGLHLGLALALALATYVACFRGRLAHHGD